MKPAWALMGVVAMALLAVGPLFLPPFYIRVGQLMLYSAGLALAWSILGGFAGYRSFGHAAFIGVGAFAAGLAENQFSNWPLTVQVAAGCLVGAAACAVVSGLLAVPILRLRGTFFAIAMLGVAHVLGELNNNIDFFQGSLGLTLANVVPGELDPPIVFYESFLMLGILILLLSVWIRHSRFGYGLLSIREDEDTARMLGVPTERYKRIAFVLSAVLTGLLGIVYGHSLGYITTSSVYRDDTSLDLIVFCLLGGIGTLLGPVIGAFLLVFLTQVVLGDLLDFHLFVTGLLLVVLILAAPDGLIGLGQRLARVGGRR
jgi:branched-chain amino acid transport system permease protein